MSEERKEFIERVEKWFEPLRDKTDVELRDFLEGEKPVDAGESYSQPVGNSYALLVYNIDLESLRYKLRREYAEAALFKTEEIKLIMKEYETDAAQAKAVLFSNHLVLCHHFVEAGVETFKRLLSHILEKSFVEIASKSVSDTVSELRKHSPRAETFVEAIGLSYIERLKQNAHLFVKTPNIGRPGGVKNKAGGNAEKNKENKKQEIVRAIKKVLEETVGSINAGNLYEIIEAEIPQITKSAVAEKMTVTRASLYNWLKEYELNFEELVGDATADFFSEWRELRKRMS